MKHRLTHYSLILAVMVLTTLLAPARPAHAAAFVVDTLADNTSYNGLCSLREAILAANNNAANTDCGPDSAADDTITFSKAGVIRLASTLPSVVAGQGALTIDGGEEITINGDTDYDNIGDVQVLLILSNAMVTLKNLTVEYGSSFWGGGINNSGGSLVIYNSTFLNNKAYFGGAIHNNNGALTVENSAFEGNKAEEPGGAIFNYAGGTFTAVNSTFSNNSTIKSGGGVANYGTALLYNVTITRNLAEADKSGTAGQGGGVWNSGTLEFRNTILAGNFAWRYLAISDVWIKMIDECSGAITNLGFSLMQNYSTSYCTVSGSAPVMGDPMLGELVKTAGLTYIHPLLPGSPAIDSANPAGCVNAAGQPLTRDQRGYPRPFDSDGNGSIVCDIGAVEYLHMLWLPLTLR